MKVTDAGELIRECMAAAGMARAEKGLSFRAAGEMMEMSPHTVARAEECIYMPKADTFVAMMDEMGFDVIVRRRGIR